MAVRRRYSQLNRPKPNHASSHMNTRSGLIARHSSMTRRVSYMWPSKVTLVSAIIRTLSRRPAAFRSSSAFLIVRSGTLPYIE